MLPNRFDNYDSFRVPKNFRIIESNPYGRLILMHEALDEFLVTNREQNKWKTRMDSESVLARHIENSGSFGIIDEIHRTGILSTHVASVIDNDNKSRTGTDIRHCVSA